MATVSTIATDRGFIAAAASGFTLYPTYTAARDAAIAASAANASAPYVTASVIEQFFGNAQGDSSVAGVPGPDAYIIQAASVATYVPKATAEATAAAASTATNGYYVARLFQTCVGP